MRSNPGSRPGPIPVCQGLNPTLPEGAHVGAARCLALSPGWSAEPARSPAHGTDPSKFEIFRTSASHSPSHRTSTAVLVVLLVKHHLVPLCVKRGLPTRQPCAQLTFTFLSHPFSILFPEEESALWVIGAQPACGEWRTRFFTTVCVCVRVGNLASTAGQVLRLFTFTVSLQEISVLWAARIELTIVWPRSSISSSTPT